MADRTAFGRKLIFVAMAVGVGLVWSGQADAEQGSAAWWNPVWAYRLSFEVPPALAKAEAITIYVDFARQLKESGVTEKFDRTSPRVVAGETGGKPAAEVPSIFEERLGDGAGWGYLTWLMSESTRVYIYFDALKAGAAKQPAQYDLPEKLRDGAVNRIRNPGFEGGVGNEGQPARWSFAGEDQERKWHREASYIAPVFSLSEERAHSGKCSTKWALGKVAGVWQDYSCNTSPRCDDVSELLDSRLILRAYAWLVSGSTLPVPIVRWWGKDGYLGQLTARAVETAPGKWVLIEGGGMVPNRATSFDVQMSTRPSDRDSVFFLDDFCLQCVYPDGISFAPDKPQYFVSDQKAVVTVRFNIGRACLIPVRAEFETAAGGDPKRVAVGMKCTVVESDLQGKTLTVTVASTGKVVVSQQAPAAKESKIVLNIGKLPAGAYLLALRVSDEKGETVFSGEKSISRVKGPFDD